MLYLRTEHLFSCSHPRFKPLLRIATSSFRADILVIPDLIRNHNHLEHPPPLEPPVRTRPFPIAPLARHRRHQPTTEYPQSPLAAPAEFEQRVRNRNSQGSRATGGAERASKARSDASGNCRAPLCAAVVPPDHSTSSCYRPWKQHPREQPRSLLRGCDYGPLPGRPERLCALRRQDCFAHREQLKKNVKLCDE